MNEYTYSVIVDAEIIAKGMSLNNALIMVEALFQKWHSESDINISIQREDTSVETN